MKPGKTLQSLQAIRAISAWLVIIDHTLLELSHNKVEDRLTHIAWSLGSAGVYAFFVISGFIMVHISWDGFGQNVSTASFIKRRFLRIAPLYWIATLAALAYHQVSATHGAHDGWREVALSLAFIPYAGSGSEWSPILPQGWTLSYEMMFYAIFAIGLSFRRTVALPAIVLSLCLLVAFGPQTESSTITFLSSPIVLWFVLGIGLATCWEWLELNEPAWLASSAVSLKRFGDASYSTYLFHSFALTMLLRAWLLARIPLSFWLVPVSLVVATVTGLFAHRFIEKPILRIGTKLIV